MRTGLSRWMLSGVALAVGVAYGCGKPNIQQVSPGPALEWSSSSLFAKLHALPDTGPGSLKSIYQDIGKMTFQKYFAYQSKIAIDAEVIIDGHSFGNPKRLLASKRQLFADADLKYATVAEAWESLGLKAPALTSTDTYKIHIQNMASRVGVDDTQVDQLAQQSELNWFSIQPPIPSSGSSGLSLKDDQVTPDGGMFPMDWGTPSTTKPITPSRPKTTTPLPSSTGCPSGYYPVDPLPPLPGPNKADPCAKRIVGFDSPSS